MRVGVIADVHAQLDALERALEVFARREVACVVCAGDVVEKGPDGDAVIATLQEVRALCVQGNHDANAVRHAALEASELSAASLAWLDALPITRAYEWCGQRVVIAHGDPTGDMEGVRPEAIPRTFRKWARTPRADVVILGHTHAPMVLDTLGLRVLNPGSACRGRPRDSHTCGVLTLPSLSFEIIAL